VPVAGAHPLTAGPFAVSALMHELLGPEPEHAVVHVRALHEKPGAQSVSVLQESPR
jgi:hypothetical protein